MKDQVAVIIGYVFMIAAVAMAAFFSKKGLLNRESLARDPMAGMFLTGISLGLILGGLGLIFQGSFWAGIVTSGIVILAALGAKSGAKRKGN